MNETTAIMLVAFIAIVLILFTCVFCGWTNDDNTKK